MIPIAALQELGYLPQSGQGRPPALIRAMREDPSAFLRGAAVQLKAAQKRFCFSGPDRSECYPSDPWPITWVEVDKHDGTNIPETVTVWQVQNGRFRAVYRTSANTGILHATPNGSWPIYLRYRVTTMQGVFPVPVKRQAPSPSAGLPSAGTTSSAGAASSAGSTSAIPSSASPPSEGFWHGTWVRWQPYDDPGIEWVSYFDGGRALHYFPRLRYGFPQSAGCVEMPLRAAHAVYRLTRIGTVVTVLSGKTSSKQEDDRA